MRGGRPALFIGHFPPPVHGMAAAMDSLSSFLSQHGSVVRIRTVPRRNLPRPLHHLARAVLVAAAISRLMAWRSRSRSAFFTVDAGHGMVYTIAATGAARALGYRVTFQHHSYAYILDRSPLMALLVRLSGRSATHVFYNEVMSADFRRVYRRSFESALISIAYATPPLPNAGREARRSDGRRVLGYMSNLTIEKGLVDAIAAGDAAVEQGLAEALILAGPIAGPRERDVVSSAEARGRVQYRGRVDGRSKEQFFSDIDVFLFPSRHYRNEAYPLVVWEAMMHGVPVIGYRVGCLTQSAVGDGGVILEPTEDYPSAVLALLREWADASGRFERLRERALAVALVERDRAFSQATDLGERLFERR